jgi:hypothetical protein
MSAADPFTRASPHYRRAMATSQKSGGAYEGWIPRPGVAWGRVLVLASSVAFWLGFAAVVAVLLNVRG